MPAVQIDLAPEDGGQQSRLVQKRDDSIIYTADEQVEMKEVRKVMGGLTISLLIGAAIWLVITIVAVSTLT
jgi:hypothetical protein